MTGRIIDVPAIAEAASRTIEARRRLATCPPQSAMWRFYSVECEGAWQTLYETCGRNTAAATLAVLQSAGDL